MGGPQLHHPVVTLATLYGAGGSVVGPQVAQRLGVPFLDRGISQAVVPRPDCPDTARACGFSAHTAPHHAATAHHHCASHPAAGKELLDMPTHGPLLKVEPLE